MKMTFTLKGGVNPEVEIGGVTRSLRDMYDQGPLFAFMVSIPHCMFVMARQVCFMNDLKPNSVEIESTFIIDDEKKRTEGKTVINKILVTIKLEGLTEEQTKKVVEELKNDCPVYNSFPEKIEIESKSVASSS
ncbi:OsmC family protein [Sulfuracidifex metallicus]|uniref:OsmC family peroxiredoxin n=1 Tax=Sulfuracidifex metallicus DSM 6482 = JCM 9184 TaxID=523847 RepID=A0A6A9QJV0_SULME|nr:OsmC family protein [Sulfuracidifex metallicus]MUN28379.1 hypothetical protein [Sulfuracidifex metallicus DSM 6482 = JCM 9184]WOE51102.1 OsmC family protein [Sulfuracidifex metallicus DSM 6482 = JCM 9184]